MPCVSPLEPDDGELLAYVDGEAGPDLVAHIDRCPHCRQRAARLARLQNRLTAGLYRMACPTTEELGEYHLGALSPDRAAAVARHLTECPHCTRELAQLQEYLGELASELEFSPLERVRVLVAQLVFGEQGVPGVGRPAPAYAGVRGEEEGPLLYHADDAQIALEVQDDAGQRDRKLLLGLVTGLETRQLEAHLWRGDEPIITVPVDELGNFVIAGLVPGRYELILSGPAVEIHIQDLDVG